MSVHDDKETPDLRTHDGREARVKKIEERLHQLETSVKRSLATRVGRAFASTLAGILLLVVVLLLVAVSVEVPRPVI